MAAEPSLAATFRLPPIVFARLVQDGEAGARRRALCVGQTGTHRRGYIQGRRRTRARALNLECIDFLRVTSCTSWFNKSQCHAPSSSHSVLRASSRSVGPHASSVKLVFVPHTIMSFFFPPLTSSLTCSPIP